ncbi:unnamed protein product [Pieris macdunnoughi]|uniref:Uncharacterized protein n=1 Tax=Pieris macdunnoughi TaxID=345717 RepID=A0A821SSF2_9NEOP|nr:unnamed protein product [Pieris macdunnoughi]
MSAATPEVRGPPPDSASPSIALPRIKPELGLNDATLFAVYCFIKNFIGLSEAVVISRVPHGAYADGRVAGADREAGPLWDPASLTSEPASPVYSARPES